MTKVIVFDFDGVIVRQSEFFKKAAWQKVFASYDNRYKPPLKEAEMKYGGGRGGDRFDILRETYRGLGEPEGEIPELVESGAKIFDEYVQERILEAGILDRDRRALTELKERYALYVNSATPREALEETIQNLKLEEVLRGVLGRPKSKVENFNEVVLRENCAPDQIVFVGDGDSDYKAAKEFGCRFVGFANDSNKWSRSENPFPVITDLHDVVQYL